MVVPFLTLYLTESLSFTLPQVGWLMSAFGIGSVAGSWIGGKLTDKIGSYKTMIFSLVLSGLCFIGLQYLSTFYSMCIGIFLVMLVADMFRPAMFVALGAYSKPENKTRSITLIRLAINLGFAAGPAAGGMIITGLGYSGLFWVDGISCILAGFLILQILNPKRATVIEEVTAPAVAQSPYRDGLYLIFILAMCLFALVFMQFISTLPIFYKDIHNLSEFHIGLLFACNGFLIFLIEMPIVKYFEDKKTPLIVLMIAGTAMMGLSFVILNMSMWVGTLVLGMLLITVGEVIVFPFSNAYAMKRAERGNKGDYLALYMMAFSFANIFSHNGGLQLIDDIGFFTTWNIAGGLSILTILLFALVRLRIRKEENADIQETTSKPI